MLRRGRADQRQNRKRGCRVAHEPLRHVAQLTALVHGVCRPVAQLRILLRAKPVQGLLQLRVRARNTRLFQGKGSDRRGVCARAVGGLRRRVVLPRSQSRDRPRTIGLLFLQRLVDDRLSRVPGGGGQLRCRPQQQQAIVQGLRRRRCPRYAVSSATRSLISGLAWYSDGVAEIARAASDAPKNPESAVS